MVLRLAFSWIVFLAMAIGVCAASEPNFYGSNPRFGTWNSPEGEYSVVISQATDDPTHSARLTLLKRGGEMTHYAFDGKLVSIYWSPGENYVAIDNHSGHRTWGVWILSLKTGQLIRANGPPPPTISLDLGNSRNKVVPYDFYLDYAYLPDVVAFAKVQIVSAYPSFMSNGDRRGGGHIGVVYGWKDATTLLKFDSVQLDNLNEQGKRLSIFSSLHVAPKGLYLSNASVHKTHLFSSEDRPPEVVQLLGTD